MSKHHETLAEPLVPAVPLSRFAPRVGGGSAFFRQASFAFYDKSHNTNYRSIAFYDIHRVLQTPARNCNESADRQF
jgi:hypothetical protein